ncbi:hypothetical protein [Cypionkella sp.]|uniref:hypothetical protein n=1 Tax=Cypionkella sp. TaxID=2811411 RepID=UPI002ABB77D8|nr:hypothetical protein [Cypionkella sp.]MDZ4392976.1 hypothetical protein [Cypionkella sp.]
MSDFKRAVNLDALKADPQLKTHPWLRELLLRWQPAGTAALTAHWEPKNGDKKSKGARPVQLRLAIRNGYVNFYCGGQSVAKVDFSSKITARIHNKYLGGGDAQKYIRFDEIAQAFPDSGDLDCWIRRTHGYQGIEKTFVDLVVGANAQIIDLEMGLPALNDASERVAPRIDLVALEPSGDGWKLVFWEAKHVKDGRIRSTTTPEVFKQLASYATWFDAPGSLDVVQEAYRENCRVLVALHKIAAAVWASEGRTIPDLGAAIRSIGTNPQARLEVDPRVRLLIDNRENDAGFCNKHLCKLREAASLPISQRPVAVHMVNSDAKLELP